ncbi:hypothetical protein D9M68_838400 [compost metagenome]
MTVLDPLKPCSMTASITRKSATAVPSLNKLSPSKIIVSRFGAPNSLNNAKTATGSVDEIIAPNSKATINGIGIPTYGNAKNNNPAIANVESSSPTTASSEIDHILSTIRRTFILNADSKIKIGKKMKKRSSGVNVSSPKKPKTSLSTGI